jgi:hypothetical protein
MGDTDAPFAVNNICNAATSPAADSHVLASGTGTWIESKINLAAFRGQRMRLRYLVTGHDAGVQDTYEAAFGFNPDPRDDGWWLDQVAVSETLQNPAELRVDDKILAHCAGEIGVGCYTEQDCIENNTSGPCQGDAPQCGPTCVPGTSPGPATPLVAEITTDPDETGGALDELLVAPGQAIALDASASTGTCLDGALHYRFSKDGGTTVLRSFSANPIYIDAPQVDTDFLVEIRCSADGPDYACSDPGTSPDAAKTVDVDVHCPGAGSEFETILAQDAVTWVWTTPVSFELLQGDLGGVSTYSGMISTGAGTFFNAAAVPAGGAGTYYIVRRVGPFCNDIGSWCSGDPTCSRDVDIP